MTRVLSPEFGAGFVSFFCAGRVSGSMGGDTRSSGLESKRWVSSAPVTRSPIAGRKMASSRRLAAPPQGLRWA